MRATKPGDGTAIMDRLCLGPKPIRCAHYPSVVCSNYVIFGFNADETVLLSSIGSVYEFCEKTLPKPAPHSADQDPSRSQQPKPAS